MSKRLKVMVISVIIALVLVLPLSAQNVTDPSTPNTLQGVADPTSNQRNATASLYKTDVDNYINVNNWSSVNFEKWFGFLHGSGSSMPNFRANLGYARKLGPVYLATRYWGNIFQQIGNDESVTLTPTYNADTNTLTQLVETTTHPDKWRNSNNHLDVLIGIAGQGIRVGFYESVAVNAKEAGRDFTKINTQDGFVLYQGETEDYTRVNGYLRPSIQWGTLLNLGGLTIKPRAGAAFNIYMDELTDNYYADYTTYNGKLVGAKNLITGNGYDNGYLQPVFAVGADLGLPKKDTVALTITLDYLMNFRVYNNDYDVNGFDGTAKGPVSYYGSTSTTTSIDNTTTTKTATLGFNDSSRFYHRIAPRFMADKAVAEGLKLGLAVQAPVTITTTSNDKYSETKTNTQVTNFDATNPAEARYITKTTEHTPGGLTESTALTVSPSVRIGASYDLIPSRFRVNAGVQLDPTVLSYTKTTKSRNGDGTRTTETVTDGNGVVISKKDTTTLVNSSYEPYTDSSTVRTNWDSFGGSVSGGFLFNFNENVALDLLATSGALGSNWTIDAASVNVMLNFKF
jgi:hypothetical protein